jgi:hypothetical protein
LGPACMLLQYTSVTHHTTNHPIGAMYVIEVDG